MRAASRFLAIAAASLLAVLAAAPTSLAAPTDPFVRTGSFDAVTPDGPYQAPQLGEQGLVFNRASGHILLIDETHKTVVQFDQAGNLVNFSGVGSPKIDLVAPGRLYIDNSGGASQGNFYVLHPGVSVEGFGPDGKPLAGWPKAPTPAAGFLSNLAVDTHGKVWFGYQNEESFLEEHNPDGTLTGNKIPRYGRYIAFDSHDNLILGIDGIGVNVFVLYAAQGYSTKYELQDPNPNQVVVDPSTDDIWMSHGEPRNSLAGTRFSDPFIKTAPFETMPGIKGNAFEFSADGQTMVVLEGGRVSIYKRQLPQAPQLIGPMGYYEVKSQGFFVTGEVDTGGGGVGTYHVEFSRADEYTPGSYTNVYPVPDYPLPHTNFVKENVKGFVNHLEPLTTYHARIVITNAAGTYYGPDTVVRTLAASDSGTEPTPPCPNALSRKQTGATGLPECRAFELVSASSTGGYDVESPMIEGQEPFAGFPDAAGFPEGPEDPKGLNRVLYGVHAGVIPGAWNPTNRGVDPYVAVRDPDHGTWNTRYLGFEADSTPTKEAFSSELGGADGGLATFAFAGEQLCFPCFATGFDTGVPLRTVDTPIGQGLGTAPAGVPATARPEGQVATMLSADGGHLIFGSKYAFAPGGNDNNGNLTIYDRNLTTNTTQIASTDTAGDALEAGDEVSELNASADGSQILIGTLEGEDPAGNRYVHLFMHRGTNADSVAIAPAATEGVLFDGMTSDGSKVFFTSAQALDGADGDSSADVYEAAISGNGTVTLSLLTPNAGGPCNPVANEAGPHWNGVGAGADCGAVAIGGGDGVADGGATYVLSPEQLDGPEGVLNQPNLYAIAPGAAPAYVATLDPNDPLVIDSTHDAAAPEAAEFQSAPGGESATFRSTAEITGVNNDDDPAVFLFRAGAETICLSCNPSLTEDPTLKAPAKLADDGLSITDDGRVFFTTTAALSIEDNNGKNDVYEWYEERPRLISSGSGRLDSELLTTTHNGRDAFFFTHDTLDENADQNGNLTKIYDARENGGFFEIPSPKTCKASDECHGPGTVAAGPPQIGSSGQTSNGQVPAPKRCKKPKVRRHGRCVKPRHHRSKHRKTTRGAKHHG
jgi:hypothetical protein